MVFSNIGLTDGVLNYCTLEEIENLLKTENHETFLDKVQALHNKKEVSSEKKEDDAGFYFLQR